MAFQAVRPTRTVKQMPEFDNRSVNRIVSAVRRVERWLPDDGNGRTVLFQKYAFTLLEDAASGIPFGSAKARIDTMDGEIEIVPVADLKYKWGILDGAKAGYRGDCTPFDSYFFFDQGPCVIKCPTSAVFTGNGPTTGQVGDSYTGLSEADNADTGSYAATGLPPGLSMDADGNITGTPTEAGDFWVAFSVTGPRSDSEPGSCPATKLVKFTISPAAPPP